jgi:rare lipoprotein A
MRLMSWVPVVLVAAGLALSGCSSKSEKKAALDPFAGTGSPRWTGKGEPPWGGGRGHIGKPYQVAGRWFKPHEDEDYDKKGVASWYGEAFNRRKTSNGEWFEMSRLTAAHPTLPLPSYVKVTNLENGRDVVVRVNDRGPFVGTRIIDLSKKTAEVLDFKSRGKANVRVQYIGPAPLNDNGAHLVAMNRELNRGTAMHRMIAAADRSRGKNPAPEVMVAEAPPKKKPKPDAAAVETVAYQPPAVSNPPSGSGIETSYFVQLGSFTNVDNAARARDQFANVWPVQFIELSGSNGVIYRIRLGPIADQADATTALENAFAAGYDDAHVVSAQAMQAALQ